MAPTVGAREIVDRPDRPRRHEPADHTPPEVIDADLPAPPPGYHREERARPGRAVLGGLLFGGAWAPALYFGMDGITCEAPRGGSESDRCSGWARRIQPAVVPGVGPLLAIRACEGHAACSAIFVADAGLQSLGLYLLISGAISRDVYVRNDPPPAPRAAMSLRGSPGGAVLSVVGSF
jgi:hypothetical protein